ncbi:YdcF family protein [Candidatus Uabimicrobium amorphum]|uniref:DUF218 domain-containing protein n=1 Tax=Uabimicrobium amorphum TaxID=2596890 RepID=A0A5S9F4F6_UABAM|nr:YdcF family protein [Candidatus Uabimicrobium amorphum]BBM85053.1 hypothetical protein UABAM_03416 [Candidatus Uabimicrobium amorphum]
MNTHHDALVVLGMVLDSSGKLNTLAQARVKLAATCYKKYNCPIVLSGGGMGEISEARCMLQALLDLQVPAQHIFLEEESLDTLGNAYFTKKQFLEKNNWFRIMVITSEFHVARTRKIFCGVLGKAFSITFLGAEDCISQQQKQQLYAMEKLFLEKLQLSDNFTTPPKRSDYK